MICSTCGCSLIRLGVNSTQAVHYEYKSVDHVFCCQGCLNIFKTSPDSCIKETIDIFVCPTCLSEKNIDFGVSIEFDNELFYFCRCPYCMDKFNENPFYYIDRLAGETNFKGLFSDDKTACCH